MAYSFLILDLSMIRFETYVGSNTPGGVLIIGRIWFRRWATVIRITRSIARVDCYTALH
jgi:hypothetical protein